MEPPRRKPRYRFAEFVVSPAQRVLLHHGRELPLIPRYFDLLLLLLERRDEAVQRREILEQVWRDVIVSDGALSQAVRTLRRTLGDDPRDSQFIRTVQRHGYRFVWAAVVEEVDDGPLDGGSPDSGPVMLTEPAAATDDALEVALAALLSDGAGSAAAREAVWRQAAETLHGLGTTNALQRLDRKAGHARARAYLRDTRWDVPAAAPVPLLGQPGVLEAVRVLVELRARRAMRLAGRRWLAAAGGGAAGGALAGLLGGLVLRFGPGSTAGPAVLFALPLVGLMVGGVGAAGVGAGLAAAEAVFRAWRRAALVVGGAVGGGAVGSVAHLLGRSTLEGLFGGDLSPVGGGFEGLIIGGAAGLGYALSTRTPEGGMATPRGAARWRAALISGATCAVAAGLLGWSGSHLGAMSLDFMSRSFPGSQVGLEPLARLLGEVEPGRLTHVAISAFEGAVFGSGVVFGLTRRPR